MGIPLDDMQIIRLYFERSQAAIDQTDKKYGKLCRSLARKLLPLPAYISKLTRLQALKRLEYQTAAKRRGDATVSFEELEECIPLPHNVEQTVEQQHLLQSTVAFLQQMIVYMTRIKPGCHCEGIWSHQACCAKQSVICQNFFCPHLSKNNSILFTNLCYNSCTMCRVGAVPGKENKIFMQAHFPENGDSGPNRRTYGCLLVVHIWHKLKGVIFLAEKLKIIPLGGLDEIGKNITVLEYGKDMIIIDCGVGFPDDDMYGVDLVIPDFSYLVANQKKLRGMFVTHGHEDHIGSIPYCMQQINCPIHGTAMTNGLIKLKLEEHRIADKVKLITHKPGDTVKAGCFSVEFIHVNHSIADAVAFCVTTPVGKVVFTGDFKIDPTASDGMIDLARFGQLGNEGVLALLADSTNVERAGYTPSENLVAESLDRQFKNCDQRIIVTTFASNMHRIQAVLATAHRHGRKVAVTGRSMENMLKVAQELGYLKVPAGTIVDLGAVKSLPKNKIVIVSTGSQGENMSALYRMAFSTHKQIDIVAGDRIIISASAIPGNEKAVSKIINELYRKGADVVYEKSEGLHVSGHACQEELKIIHGLIKPKFFIPVHGEQRHLQIHGKLATQMGMNPRNIHIGEIGSVVELSSRTCKINGTVPAGQVFVDGTGVGDVGAVVLRDRKHLAQDGMIVVCVNISGQDGSIISGPDIITRGFIYVKESEELMDELREVAMEAIDRCARRRSRDWATIKSAIKNDLSGYLYKTTKRNPMILPVITEL